MKKLRRLLPKKSVGISELRLLAGQRATGEALKPKFKIRCEECRFIELSDSKLRFISASDGRIVCEICFETLNISEWEFVKR